jgi:hypothetical protein
VQRSKIEDEDEDEHEHDLGEWTNLTLRFMRNVQFGKKVACVEKERAGGFLTLKMTPGSV